ncbi:MAG: response regulator, partial [Anaerolineae bacterium]
LAGCAAVAELPGLEGSDAAGRANSVRRVLLDAIEFLRPARREPLRSLAARSYAVLWLRYVEGLSVSRVAEELALGDRQTHRELRLAEAKLAETVGERLSALGRQATPEAATGEASELLVVAHPAVLDIAQTVTAAVQMVRPLAQAMAVELIVDAAAATGQAYFDEGILRQLLIQCLSLGVQHCPDGIVRFTASRREAAVRLSAQFHRGAFAIDTGLLSSLQQLATTLGLGLQVADEGDDTAVLAIDIPLRQPRSILVVEDNSAATQLYRRYLEPSGDWRVVAVPEPRLAYDMARQIQPALVILDVLMPTTDGWTILNLLHAHQDTADIPVVVCSVFQDVLLAQSLGAKEHLRKPVSREQLLAAVTKWAR